MTPDERDERSMNLPDLEPRFVYEAIAEGVRQAFWQAFNNATDMPCHDLYATIEDGVRKAIENITRETRDDD